MQLGATTEGTGSYTTGSASAATGLRLSARETPQSDGSLPIPASIYAKTTKDALDETQDGLVASVRWSLADDLSLITGARVIDWQRDESHYRYSTGETQRTSRSETAAGSYLDPLEGVNYELGLKSEFWDKRLTGALSVFEVHQDNLAVPDGLPPGPNGEQTYRSESGTKTRGFEMEMAGEIMPGWQASASYTYAEARDADDKRLLTEVPRDTFKLFTSYRLQSLPQLKVGGGVRWQGAESYRNSGPNKETFYLDAYSIVDLMAQYAFIPQTSVSLNLNNALDKTYYTAIGARGWYGTPRSATATLVYAF